MNELKIQKSDISIDSQGRVVIDNPELKARVDNFLNDTKLLGAHDVDSGLFDNCDCKCKPE
jgi:hypothetical protein